MLLLLHSCCYIFFLGFKQMYVCVLSVLWPLFCYLKQKHVISESIAFAIYFKPLQWLDGSVFFLLFTVHFCRFLSGNTTSISAVPRGLKFTDGQCEENVCIGQRERPEGCEQCRGNDSCAVSCLNVSLELFEVAVYFRDLPCSKCLATVLH